MTALDTRAQIDSLMAWWRDAGVDTAIAEAPFAWLTAPTVPGNIAGGTPPTQKRVETFVLPTVDELPPTHSTFLEWLRTDDPRLAAFPAARRVAPEGSVGATLMVVTDVPEAADVDTGRLLSGEVGDLLEKMLAAIGHDRQSIYLATLAPSRPPTGRLDDAAEELLAPILLHHIALVAPAKLWLLGRAASRAVLGMDEVTAQGRLHCVNQGGITIDAIATAHPRVLLREPRLKGRVWKDMQRLSEEPKA